MDFEIIARMKKAAPLPPSKVTTPLSQSLSDLHVMHQPQRVGPPSSDPLPVNGIPLPPSMLRDQGDECAINELLEGRMDLDVVLPDARKVRMNVERRTPMMDLLVQVTTAHKINPGGHVIHIPTDRGRDYLQYKPNTPIGSLDTNSIHIVPKSAVFDPPIKKMPKMANKPFERTFRLQVNLPRNQLMVMRVGPRTTLSEVKLQACREKNLDPSRYMLAHPQRQDAILDLNSCMESYRATEITLISISNFNANVCNSTSDLIAYTREDNQKKKSLLGLFSRKKSKTSIVDSSSDSLDSRGVSPSRSDGSGPRTSSAKVSLKKRQAPPPPPKPPAPVVEVKNQPIVSSVSTTITTTTTTGTTTTAHELTGTIEPSICKSEGSMVSHSRHSSDSSGYHEASLLSESPENPSPDVCSGSGSSGLSVESTSHTVINRRKSSTPTKPTQAKCKPMLTSLSDTQLLANNRKRRAPLPPPPVLPKSEEDEVPSSSNEVIEEIILEEPITEMMAENECPELKTPPPEPSSSPPISEAESGLVEDIERPLPPLLMTGSPTSEDSLPASPHADSGLAQEDMEDVDLIYPYTKGPAHNKSADHRLMSEMDTVIEPPAPFLNPLLKPGVSGTMHEPVVATRPTKQFNTRAHFSDAFTQWLGTNSKPTDGGVRRTSLTSLGTIDDVQNAFDLTIAEAQKVLEDEEKRLSFSSDNFHEEEDNKDPSVEVTQHQILSRIEAAFSAVEEETKEETKPLRSPMKEDDLGWEYTIPEPPPAFRNDAQIESKISMPSSKTSSVSSEEVPLSVVAVVMPTTQRADSTLDNAVVSKSQEKRPEHNPTTDNIDVSKSPEKRPELHPESGTSVVKVVTNTEVKTQLKEPESLPSEIYVTITETEGVQPRSQAPKSRRPPLLNFTIGTYRTPKEDIFSPSDVDDSKSVPNTVPVSKIEFPVTGFASLDVPKTPAASNILMYGMEGSVRGIKGQVRQRCAEMVDTGGPTLVARSASMLSLTPTTRKTDADSKNKSVQRTISNVTDKLRKTQSVQDLNSNDCISSESLEQEERLQELQQKLLAWNKQLQCNQKLLEKQKIVPATTQISLPVKEPDKVPASVAPCGIASVAEEVAARSQTLPRTKPKAAANEQHAVEEKRTFTLDRRPKYPVLANVTIGSWQQRRSSENINTLPTTEKPQFHSLDTSSAVVTEEKCNGHYPATKPPVSKRPVSMYASWQKPSFDETDRQRPKFDVHFSSSQSNSLRTSSTKTYFKPPELKNSSVSRQRIPPEDIDCPSEEFGASMASWKNQTSEPRVIKDSGMLKKFSYGQNECNGSGKTVTYLNAEKNKNDGNVKMLQVNGKVHVSNGLGQRPSFSLKTAPKVVGFRTSGMYEPTRKSAVVPEPPPPPPAQEPAPKVPSLGLSSVKADLKPKSPSARSAKPLRNNSLDPREELMSEIRNFGGRNTLKKVPVNQVNWQLKVHGSNSTITA